MKEKFTIIADPRVKEDLKEARDFLNTKRKTGYNIKATFRSCFVVKTLVQN